MDNLVVTSEHQSLSADGGGEEIKKGEISVWSDASQHDIHVQVGHDQSSFDEINDVGQGGGNRREKVPTIRIEVRPKGGRCAAYQA